MRLERLERFVDAINKYHEREELLAKALEPFNDSYTIIEFCPDIIKCIFDYINEEFEDIGDWFGYWFYELDQGKNKTLGGVLEDGAPIKLDTLEDVYNFMLKNKASR